ncbi:MAG TPA: Cof-type HAD-IIB family hydrolase [Tissierellales bacterium]|nr:Cof-type HAD-IIB family hydrolase [Tissierellales bacterium]
MKYELIAIDMDGTLLNSDNEISSRNKRAIKKAKSLGANIILSTGRLFTSANEYAESLGLTTPIISCNGAFVAEKGKSNVIYDSAINKDVAKEVIKMSEKEEVYYHFYDDETFYLTEKNASSELFKGWTGEKNIYHGVDYQVMKAPLKEIEKNQIRVYKYIVVDRDIERLLKFRKKISQINGVEIASSWSNNIEIMNKGVTKGNGLKLLCEKFNIPTSKVIAIGDNENDISMLKMAGLGVAMENGEEKAKEYADYITDNNDRDGVAKVIEKFVLNKN